MFRAFLAVAIFFATTSLAWMQEPAAPKAPKLPPQPPFQIDPKFKPNSQEEATLTLINKLRAKEKMAPLSQSSILGQLARRHSENMVRHDKLDHVLDENGPDERTREAGYKGYVAENCAAGSKATPERFVQLWADSPDHLANILHKTATEIGVGYGISADGKKEFYTAVFGVGVK